MSEQVGAIHYDLGLNDSEFNRKLETSKAKMEALSGKFKQVGQSMTNVGKKMTIGVTLPIVAGAGMAAVDTLNSGAIDLNTAKTAFATALLSGTVRFLQRFLSDLQK